MGFYPVFGYERYHLNHGIGQQLGYASGPIGMGEQQLLNEIENKDAEGDKRYNRKQKDKRNG
jgi:hypothetical protein